MNLVVRRLIRNEAVRSFYGVQEVEVLADANGELRCVA
jgi:hypothetical protein